MKKAWLKWLLFGFLMLLGLLVLFYLRGRIDSASTAIAFEDKGVRYVEIGGTRFREVNWRELVQLDYKTGNKGGNLSEIENQWVRIPGYIVPLSDETAILDDFVFVPNDQACIHVPSPPPNLMILAKLRHKMSFEDVFNPSWLMGRLEIVETESFFGPSSYRIQEAEIEKYNEPY